MSPIGQDDSSASKPDNVQELESAYGPPGDAAFGSAVFYRQVVASDGLEPAAISVYRTFVGELWERYGEDAWMGPWGKVYDRAAGADHDVVTELRSIDDRNASQSVPMLIDVAGDPERARSALSAVYDAADTTELSVYTIGDGEAMSGLLLAGRHPESGATTFLVFLMD